MEKANKKQVSVESRTRNPNIFNVTLERNPQTGEFTVVGRGAKRLVMKNQFAGEWKHVGPRAMARALRNNKVTSA
jgi:hypothetical protein